ncbi:sulfite exporter TauE/SafE family protein [Octadecabacter sp.]|nr:sulfite exporter TauE/SafE family protein [Octadecabacter sp.]
MDGFAFWALASLAAFCVGLSKGGAPAFGALAVPIMSLVISPLTAAGLLLPVFIFSDIFGVWAYRDYFRWPVIKIAVVGIFVGTGIGWATAHLVSEQQVRILIGLIGFFFALNFLFRADPENAEQPADKVRGYFWTTIAGFTSFVSHAGAPPWQVWALPQNMPKMVFAGTSAMVFAIMNLAKVVPYYQLGQLQLQSLQVTAILCVPAVIAVFVAYQIVKVVPTRVFYTAVTWMLLAVSIKLIWDGVVGL